MNRWYIWLKFTFLKFLFSNWVREFGEAGAPVWEGSLRLLLVWSSGQVVYGGVIHPASELSLPCAKLFSTKGCSPSKIDSYKGGILIRNLHLPKNLDLLSHCEVRTCPSCSRWWGKSIARRCSLLGSGRCSLCWELKEPSLWGRGLKWSGGSVCAWALGTF